MTWARRPCDRTLLGLRHLGDARRWRPSLFLRRLRLATGIRKDSIEQHATMLGNQPLNLEVRLVIGLDVVEQRHVVNIFSDLVMNFGVGGRALVQPERGDDIVLAERRQAWLADVKPEKDLEHDGDVDDVSHEAAEDAWTVEKCEGQVYCISLYRWVHTCLRTYPRATLQTLPRAQLMQLQGQVDQISA